MWFKRWLNAIRFPRQLVDSIRRSFSFASGVYVNEDSAMQVSAFYRGVMFISTQIAKLPWEIKNSKNEIIENDEIGFLLNLRPNPEMNSMFFRLCMIQNAIIHGNSYAEIERDTAGRVKALWPIDPKYVELYRTTSGDLVYRVMGGSNSSAGQDAFLPFNDVFHVRNFHTKDGLNGQGIVAYAMETLGISIGSSRMASGLFSNSGIPSGTISVEGKLNDEAYARIKNSWQESHGGKKSGGTAVLEQGAKFSAITMQPDVMQFLESRKFSVIEIARFLGIPPTKLYDTETAKYSNIENSNLEVATDTLDTWARSLEQEADTKLLKNQHGGRRSELDLYAVFRGDMETRSAYFSKMMQTGSITPNEIRKKEGMAPYKGGNDFYIAVNNYSPQRRVDEIIDAQIAKSKNAGGNPSEKPPGQTEGTKAELEQAAIEYLKKGT